LGPRQRKNHASLEACFTAGAFRGSIRIRKRNRNGRAAALYAAPIPAAIIAPLNALYLVASELRLQITFSDKSAYRHHFQIPEPTNNGEVLFRMLHTHLENFQSDFPIIVVALKAEAGKPSYQQFPPV
jgi:hypothetical protein